MKVRNQYIKDLRKQFGYLATWLPGTPLSLGDIGIIKNNQFNRISSLEEEGISFDIEKDSTPLDIEYSSENGVSISFKASGSASFPESSLGKVDAGALIRFSKENAVYFKSNNTYSPSIKNQIKLGNEIISRYQKGQWNKSWAVITELVQAESSTILISNSSEALLELKAKGKLSAAQIDLADASLGLGIQRLQDLAVRFIAEKELTPLFKVSKIKKSIFSSPSFKVSRAHQNALKREHIDMADLITPAMAKKDASILSFEEYDPFKENPDA